MQAPIGIFDSGLGGLTVLKAARQRLPAEDFLYFADTRFLPYGERDELFLRERGRHVAEILFEKGCKALVIACNTATAAAAEAIRSAVEIPVVALEPAVKPAAALTRVGVLAVLATTRTLASPRFARLIEQHGQGVQVLAQPCPGLAEAIEENGPQSDRVGELLDRYVTPVANSGADVVVLGCTHYPWVATQIAQRLSSQTHLVDTGDAVARQLERVLLAAGIQGGGQGRLVLASSGAPAEVNEKTARLWGERLSVQHWDF